MLTYHISQTYAQQTIWYYDLKEAQAIAKEENKLILLDFGASWERHSSTVKKELKESPKGQKLLNSFIPVTLDFDRNIDLVKAYDVASIPTLIITDYEGQLLYQYSNYASKKQVVRFLEHFPPDVVSLFKAMKAFEISGGDLHRKKVEEERSLLEQQIGLPQYSISFNEVKKRKGIPPGTVLISNLYVDRMEMQNVHWQEYLYYKSKEANFDSLEAVRLIPAGYADIYQNPEYRNKPLVNVSYEQALAYCAWRSEIVSKRMGMKITYRLPTPEEWSQIAQTILYEDIKQTQRFLKQLGKEQVKHGGRYFLFENLSPFVYDAKVYNFFGNVSEMTSIKGIAMGLNNGDKNLDAVKSTKEIVPYIGPDPYLGFRCVADVEEYK